MKSNTQTLRMIMDSLRYWVQEMHVDGFRFDLASILARDGYVPRQLANQGDRLAFSNGIIGLSVFAAVLLVIFGGGKHTFLSLRSPDRVPVPRELAAAGCAAVIVRRV